MEFLCVFDQPLQQRRWRVVEMLTQSVEDELACDRAMPNANDQTGGRIWSFLPQDWR